MIFISLLPALLLLLLAAVSVAVCNRQRGASTGSTVSLPWGLEPAIHEACKAEERRKEIQRQQTERCDTATLKRQARIAERKCDTDGVRQTDRQTDRQTEQGEE